MVAQKSFFERVYFWMFAGLLISGLAAVLISSSSALQQIFYSPLVFFGLIIIELTFVFIISARIGKLKTSTATTLFILYSLLNGLTLSVIFLEYNLGTISFAFFVAAIMFGLTGFYGATPKKDLSSLGSVLFMALMGLVIALLINLFVRNSLADLIFAWVGVIIFSGLAAYDNWKIKHGKVQWIKYSGNIEKASIFAALGLYLDFVNLFLSLLRIFGRRD